MKMLILLLLLTMPAFADTLLDQPATGGAGRVLKGNAWENREYRALRRQYPGWTEAQLQAEAHRRWEKAFASASAAEANGRLVRAVNGLRR